MAQFSVLKGQPLSREIPYRDPDALFALSGADGNGKNAYLPVGRAMLERNTLLLGGAATGKTALVRQLARNIRVSLNENDCMIVLDTNGESYSGIHQKGDLTLAADERAGKNGWNLFRELSQGEQLLQDASALCGLMFENRIAAARDPLSETAARDLTMALIVYLSRRGEQSLLNNHSLRELIEGFDCATMRELLLSEPDLKCFSAYLEEETSPRTLGILSALQKAARELLPGQFGAKGTLAVSDVLSEPEGKTLFIASGMDGRDTAAALCGYAIRQCLSHKKKDGKVYFIMDDFCALPAISGLEDGLLHGRSAGSYFILSAPGVYSVEQKYGAKAPAILSLPGTVAAFQLRDKASRTYVQDLHGLCHVLESTASLAQPRNVLEQIVDEPAISDDVLTSLQPGEVILSTMHYPPFLFRLKAPKEAKKSFKEE